MDQADIIKWYQKASLFVLPSFGEGFPVTTLEALSCETPVIATPVGGIPEIVKNYENGILIPPNDPAALARAIQYLLENKKIRTKFGREGRKRIIKHYSLEASVKKLCWIYEQLNSCIK
jgi:glycosyltransferase involved in cell wall biosynthesis